MIPDTIILGTIRVPTTIIGWRGETTFIICGGPYAMTMKGEFYRDQQWSKIEHPLDNSKGSMVKCRIFGDHYFLYKTNGAAGRYTKAGNSELIQRAFNEFMSQTKEAIAA